MDTKFCTACQVTRPLEGGIKRKTGRIVRWICKMCQERKNISPYASKGAENALRK